VHPRISVSALCSWSNSFGDDLAMWERLGVDQVGLFSPKLDAADWDDSLAEVRRRGLDVGTMSIGHMFDLRDPGSWPETRDAVARKLDGAASVGADCGYITSGRACPLTWDEAIVRLQDAVGPSLERARELGLGLAFEANSPQRTDSAFVHTLRDAIDVAECTGLGVDVEISNHWMERQIDDTLRAGVAHFALVQVSDYKVGTHLVSAREVPGDGDIPLKRLLGVLLDAGYAESFELELVGPAIEEQGYEVAVRRGVDALTELLVQLGA
jgi:sugar phosphate isomerase/epimerase